jgi:CHAD domain-containing protein
MVSKAEQPRAVLKKLGRRLKSLMEKPLPENVHGFRTSARRVETVLVDLGARPGRNEQKLIKMLRRLYKQAGRIRDLDVQIAALRSLKIPQETSRKTQLLAFLAEQRLLREAKLRKSLDKATAREIRRRLKRAAATLAVPVASEVLASLQKRMARLTGGRPGINEKKLHQYRLEAKKIRYLVELAGEVPLSPGLAEQLRRTQNLVGDWHDWASITNKAQGMFGGVQDSAMVAALNNLTRAKYREAVSAFIELRAVLTPANALASRKPPERAPRKAKAAAA